ncbi:dimethylhistidine N-methyltransferase [Nitrospirillum amazonense]|uniref:Dimethylhistidine N-methyltransferase n=1 Tax=Nitrospirillum amazonense TaxID=28077 RepID=A0A560EU48_9PROT|nr:L-histidine N(alpha)-methyltransferase [Nitrospirillum amazonense]TWB12805.1 dimethylhistidine N-methyltransferase [Nitrospirillum amazonense]
MPDDQRIGNATPATATFLQDVLAGLGATPKSLNPKYFYDAEGSRLFEEICNLPEYYVTRTETALLTRVVKEIASSIPAGAALVEFGSGASSKTGLLLDAAPHIDLYVPIDISVSALEGAVSSLAATHPALRVVPLVQDFTQALSVEATVPDRPLMGFFPGSTIGNLLPEEAEAFLRRARHLLGADARFLIGADLVKPTTELLAAYDDAQGVTATFNLNVLRRINRELGATFDLDGFRHQARWNAGHSRIEMHLVSRRQQLVRIGDRLLSFDKDESIHTENSHKYTPTAFAALAEDAGWRVARHWINPAPAFGLFLLTTAE